VIFLSLGFFQKRFLQIHRLRTNLMK